ncbi:hypothetical protein DFR29_1093 [Tahibacter aquaticus]|uniref:Uncharacterized protein n=1 Tax=Tahibacter aquaticus TaxID=520092 RepID=A0A4V3DLZ6_9GAMM|nr:hypothetical protein [Tahibacter aquaticus]TDR41949.1 hypothetical protein DFR29_1093 [Tahibacter aquaticus]
MPAKKTKPTWTDVKKNLASFDNPGLIALLHDLYTASKDNQAFLHTRFGLGDDVLKPYKATLTRWLWPNWLKNQNTSVTTAKKAIADYKKAVGQPDGLAELMVFYCEQAAAFSSDVGLDDESYYDALVRMFEQALKTIAALPEQQRPALWTRLDQVRRLGHQVGYGISTSMDELLIEYGVDARRSR